MWWTYNVWPKLVQALGMTADPLYRSPNPPEPGREWGVDVSWWQGQAIDWRAVRRAGASFAFLRASCGLVADATYQRNWREMGSAAPAMSKGAYHYLKPEHDPVEQASLFVEQCRLGPPDLGLVWVDVEEDKLTDAQVRAFVNRAEGALGQPVGIYTSKYKAGKIKLGPWVGSRPLWVADWRNVTEPALPKQWQEWAYWQYTSSGHVPGIPGRVDLSWRAG
jgi:lysozyme